MRNEMLVDTIEYRDHKIEIHRDFDPMNPFEDWDCEVPILVAYLDHARYNLKSYGVEDALPYLPDEVVKEHCNEMLEAVDWRSEEFFIPSLRKEFGNYYHAQSAEERLELLERVYGWMGITAVLGSTTGYCQGDYAKVLAVATSEWVKTTGCPPENLKAACEGAIELYGYWAWGDVYGYVIDGDGDSCCGFYGNDHEKSGLLEQAQDAIDYLLRQESIDKDTEALTCD